MLSYFGRFYNSSPCLSTKHKAFLSRLMWTEPVDLTPSLKLVTWVWLPSPGTLWSISFSSTKGKRNLKNMCTWACAFQEAWQQEAEITPSPHHFRSKRDNYTMGDPTQHRCSLKPRFYEPLHQAPPLRGEDDSRFCMEYKDTPFGDKSTTTESRTTPDRCMSSSTQCGYFPSVTGHLLKMSSAVVTSKQPWNKQVQTLTTHHTVWQSRLHPRRTPLSPSGQTTSLPTTASHDDLNTLRPTLLEKLQAFHWENNYCHPW